MQQADRSDYERINSSVKNYRATTAATNEADMHDNSLMNTQDADIRAMRLAWNRRSLIGRRNRLLLLLAASTGVKASKLLTLQLWQVTFFATQPAFPETSVRQDFPLRVLTNSLGFYSDETCQRVVVIPKAIRALAVGYMRTFGHVEDRSSYLFPAIRKNESVAAKNPLTIKDAHKILKGIRASSVVQDHYDWDIIRHIAVAKMLASGCSVQEIQHQAIFKDPKSIKSIAAKHGLPWRSDPSFRAPGVMGLDYRDSVLSRNTGWYPEHLYHWSERHRTR